MGDLPDQTNFFSSLHTQLSRRRIAKLFRRRGWVVRKCGWAEDEMQCPFAELVVEAGPPTLMHGAVADVTANVQRGLAPLRGAGVCYSAECCHDGAVLPR